MLKRLFQSYHADSDTRTDEARDHHISAPLAVPVSMEPRVAVTPAPASLSTNPAANHAAGLPTILSQDSFDLVYESAGNKPPASSYGILKVAEMVNSPHLAGMSPEVKRNCILMALDAAGAEIDYLLEDAVFRQRALNDHEDFLEKRIRDFESAKSEEIGKMQAELDRLTTEHVARIQSSLDEIAREQDRLRVWQKRKQSESQRIADAAMYCVPKNSQSLNDGFATLLERGAAASWR